MRFHINGRGESDECDAPPGKCPLGGQHYESGDEADRAFEAENDGNLFAPQGKLITNRLDDAYNEPQVNPLVVGSDNRTMPEDMAVEDQELIEADIAQHKKAVANGFSPYELKNLSSPRGVAKTHGDPDAITRAWHQEDYDKIRELYATAHVRQYSNDPDFRYSVSDLIAQARS